MKMGILFLTGCLLIGEVRAQHNTPAVPPVITRAFDRQYPAGRVKNWQIKDGKYWVSFRSEGKKYLACYDPDGGWQTTQSTVRLTRDLPQAARKAWNSCDYKDWLILDIKKIQQPGSVLYAIHVGQVQSLGPDDSDIGSEYILFFSENGRLVRTERKA